MDKEKSCTEAASRHRKTKLMVLTGLLFATALVLSLIENSLPPILVAIPGVKFGLSNIAVMYALFFLQKRQAFSIAVLKAVFVWIYRGYIAGILSLSGGLLSLVVMTALLFVFKEKISYTAVSIFGSIFHNIGQFIAISFIYSSMLLWPYLPLLLAAGLFAGLATATLLKLLLPAIKKLGFNI